MIRCALLLLFGTVGSVICACADHSFLGCVLRLKAHRVPFERNILNVVFNVGSEAKLLHTCKVYSATLPCFREKVEECGDEKQRRLLNEVGKMLMFLCTPFSLKRQQNLIRHQKCVSSVLALPASTGCKLLNHSDGDNVIACKRKCSARKTDFLCMMRTWISEQNVCTLQDIESKCGAEASDLYNEMQRTVFEPQYPVICEYKEEIASTTTQSVTTTTATTTTSISTPRPTAHLNRVHIYRKPARTFTVTAAPVVFRHVLNVTTEQTPVVWTKKPSLVKSQYNKELWKYKSMYTTPSPYETTPRTISRSYKVMNLLKSLLPDNMPKKLSSLFENSLEKHSFNTKDHYNTPGVTEATTPPRVTETTSAVIYTTMMPAFHPGRSSSTAKWRPWYLGGTD